MRSKSALRRTVCLASTALAITLLGSAPAFAQAAPADTPPKEKPASDDAIIVTGTRVSQKVADQPIQTFSGSFLNDQGYTNVGEALTSLPVFGTPANSPVGGQGSFGAGQTFINLYNLGAQRTLTLVNGNRFVGSATSSLFGASVGTPVDLGQIAPALVDRIDIVSVGGAPIYGADAIAGTVNVILKHDYNGIDLTASDGIAQQGDGRDYNFSLLVGHNFAGGRGNVTLNVYYDHQDGLTTAARDITSSGPNSSPFYEPSLTNSAQQVAYTGGLRYNPFTSSGIPVTGDSFPFYAPYPPAAAPVQNAAGQTLYFNPQGKLVPFTNGTPTGSPFVEGGGSGFPLNDFGNLLTNTNRIQGTLLWHYDVSDNIRAHGEVWLGKNTSSNLAAQPYYSTALFGPAGSPNGNLILNTANPFLSAADRATLQNAIGTPGQDGTFYMERANTDLETGAFATSTYLFRTVGGLDGDFALGTHKFTWDVTVNYGRSSAITKTNELITQNFFNALNAVSTPNGPACAPGYTSAAIAAYSSTCAPLNVFGVGNESQAAINYVTAPAQTHQVDTQFDFVANIKGDLIHLPAGEVKVALGVEARRESQSFDPGAFYRGQLQSDGTYTQYGNSIPITPVSGSYHTHEVYGELTVPLLGAEQHVPLIHDLNFHGAARYTDNSLNGGNWSYTVGGNYAPFAGFTFRGNYTHSFREPSVTEAFAPQGSTYEFITDPCDRLNLKSGPNPAVRQANCAAVGLTAASPALISETQNIQGVAGGNPHLGNELATSWTAGVQANPHFIPGLQVTADYVNITIQNEIAQPGITAELDACYDSSSFPNNPYCSTFSRNSTGNIATFTDFYSNIAVEAFRALQVGTNYTLPLNKLGLPDSAGRLIFSANYLHTYRHYTKLGTQDKQLVLGSYTNPVDSANANIDYQSKRFDWLWTVIFYGPTVVDPNAATGEYEYPRVSPYWMFNSSIGFHATEHMDFRLSVNNVFNTGLPQPNIYLGGTNKYFDAIMGRYFRVTAKVRF